MKGHFHSIISLFLALSILLSACAGMAAPAVVEPAEPTAVVTEAPEAAPVEVLPEATEEPAVEPAPDFMSLFQSVIDGMAPDKGYGTVKPSALSEELATKPPFILDLREPAEVEKDGFIEGAVNIPVRDVLKNLDKLPDFDQPIVIYCASGHRGGMAYATLKMLGYTNVRNLAGGLGAWKKASLPVVTGSMPAQAVAVSTPIIENQGLYAALDGFFNALPEGFYTVKSDKLSEALASSSAPFLVDIRTAEEYAKDGYIEGSVNLPLKEILGNLDKLPAKDQPIVVYCVSGHRGSVVTLALQMLGYTNVANLAGGLNAWKAAKMPVVGWVDWPSVWGEYLAAMPQGYSTIKADALNSALVEGNPPFLLDVREPAELEKDGYIEEAVNIPVRDLLKNLDKLPGLTQPIVVYCASGHRGGIAMAALQLLGYNSVTNLAGGLGAWKKAEFPVVTGAPTAPAAGSQPDVDATRLNDLGAFISALPEGFFSVKAPDLNGELIGSNPPVVVDVRTSEEFGEGHIEGAVNVDFKELFAGLDKLPADKSAQIVVYCASGHRGAIAMMALRMTGFSEVRNLAGGMNAWAAAELPVVK